MAKAVSSHTTPKVLYNNNKIGKLYMPINYDSAKSSYVQCSVGRLNSSAYSAGTSNSAYALKTVYISIIYPDKLIPSMLEW